jgi:ubiquinone biosynthesis protein
MIQILKQILVFLQVGILYLFYKCNYIPFYIFVKNVSTKLTNLSYYYIKIFQWQLQDTYMNDNELDEFFTNFTNNVPYNNSQINRQLIFDIILFARQNNYELTIENHFLPVNSGTIALVWKGKLNNKNVAIKIIRNNIINEIKHCVNTTCFLIDLIRFVSFGYFDNTSFINIIRENESKLLEQCNFSNEAENIDLFYNIYKNSDTIVIPKVYREFTEYNNTVLIMDFIDGKHANQLTNEEKIKFAPVYNFFYNDSIFAKNICHSDLHIGNVVFIKTADNIYKIGIYDFGLVYKLTKQESKKLFKLLTMLSNKNRRGIIETLVDFSMASENKEKRDLLVECLLTKDIFFENISIDFKQINIIFKEGFKHNLLVNKNSSAILLSFISSIYLSKIFADNKSIAKTFKNYLYSDTIKCD